MLYFSFIFSNIYYCAEIYGNTHDQFIKGLQKVHNKTLRALQYKSRYYLINQLHKNYDILKVKDVIFYKSMLNIFNIINHPDSIPKIIVDQISINSHHYSTRSKHPLMVNNNNNTIVGSKLMSCAWSKKWNLLPDSIQNAPSKDLFKKRFYEHTLESYASSQFNFAIEMV